MTAGDTHTTSASGGPPVRRQWLGLMGAPVVWLAHFVVNYALAARACRWMTTLPLHVVSATALVMIVIIGGIAWSNFDAANEAEPGEPARVVGLSAARIRLMGVVGLMAAILFFLVVVAQWLPTWTADPCQR